MWWILLLGAAIAVWWYFRRAGQAQQPEAHFRPGSSEKTMAEQLQGEQKPMAPAFIPEESSSAVAPDDKVITIGENLPLPLNLTGILLDEARKLVKGVNEHEWATQEWLTLLIAKNNIRCQEVDAWAATSRKKVEASVQAAIKASPEWESASELDREDMLQEFRDTAIEALDVRPADVDAADVLLFQEPTDHTVDDELLERFNGDAKAYSKLLYLLANPGRVWTSPAGSYDRKDFEDLVAKGYVRRGADIPLDDILPGLTLPQMQQIAGEAAPKKLTRKAPAIELLKGLPDIQERLSKVVSFRELFQLVPQGDLNQEAIVQSYAYAGALARLIWRTLASGKSVAEQVARSKEYDVDEWELSANDCCPSCMKLEGKTWKRLPKNLPPFHIGCEAEINGN